MRAYSIYDLTTGRILRWGNCQPQQFGMQAQSGEGIVDGAYDGDLYIVVDGQPTARPTARVQSQNARSFILNGPVPEGATAKVASLFVSSSVQAINGSTFALEVPEAAVITITAPFPFAPLVISLEGEDDPIPAGAHLFTADVERMRSHYVERVKEVGIQLLRQLLRQRSDVEALVWNAQRDLLTRHRTGQITATDTANIAEALIYRPEDSAQDVLDEIAALVEYQDFVALRHRGLQEEALRRIAAAATAGEVLAAKNWVEAEALLAVQEAMLKRP